MSSASKCAGTSDRAMTIENIRSAAVGQVADAIGICISSSLLKRICVLQAAISTAAAPSVLPQQELEQERMARWLPVRQPARR